jgi:hypothetical protein
MTRSNITLLVCFFGGISGFTSPSLKWPRTTRRTKSLGILKAENEDTSSSIFSRSSSSLYQEIPKNKPWTFGLLTSGFPPQQFLVPFVKFVTFQVWQGRFIRESFQAGNDPSPLALPSDDDSSSGEEYSRYKLYLGNPCPWCHR